jgi:hypothetical protein
MRAVNNTILCANCGGSSGAITGGQETDTNTGLEILGNYVTGASCAVAGGVSNKQYHSMYFGGNGIEVGWNKIANVCTYNGLQINYGGDDAIGFGGLTIHDNDIEGVNGSGINLSTVDSTQGAINVYNNIIHHTGIQPASDGGYFFSCISFPGEAPSAGASTVNVYNNTMYDCSSYLNSDPNAGACVISMTYETAQTNLTINLKNNIFAAPAYTYAGSVNPYICYAGSSTHPSVTGSNNIFYSATTPGTTAPASGLTSLAIPTNPLFTSTATPSAWTNLVLQSTSPALGAGVSFGSLTTDFTGGARASPPSIGACEK